MSDALPTASRFGRRDFLTAGLGIAGGVTLWAGGLTGPATAAGTERAFRRRSRASRSLTTNALLSTTDRPPSTSSWSDSPTFLPPLDQHHADRRPSHCDTSTDRRSQGQRAPLLQQ